MIDLLLCPFCGGEPEWINLAHPSGIHALKCPECQFSMQQDRRDKTVFYWNRRAPQQQTDSLGVDEADEFLAKLNSWLAIAEKECQRLELLRDQGEDVQPNYSLEGRSRAELKGVIKAYKDFKSTPPTSEALKGDAIGFAEWIKKNWSISKGRYRHRGDFYHNDKQTYTTTELYNIFKTLTP